MNEKDDEGAEIIEAVKDEALDQLGYFLKPSELFHAIAAKGNHQSEGEQFIIGDLTRIFKNIEQSTQGTASADEFIGLFDELDLTSSKLGNTEKAKNELVTKIMINLDKIDFDLESVNADVLGELTNI